jgi:hypothetical protein
MRVRYAGAVKRIALLPVVAALGAVASAAHAGPTAEDSAAAQQLYDDAGKLMHAERDGARRAPSSKPARGWIRP